MHHALLIVAALCLFAPASQATTVGVYHDRAEWEAAMSEHGKNPLTSISFDDSLWTERMEFLPRVTQKVSQSTGAASDGMVVSAISGFSAPGLVDSLTLGHVANGLWNDQLSKYGSTTFQFSTAIYGLGGVFHVAQANGLFLGGGVGEMPQTDGFLGFISDQPMDSLFISWGQSGDCLRCFGNSYTLGNLEVATLPTPEPNYGYALAGMFIVVAGYAAYRRSRA